MTQPTGGYTSEEISNATQGLVQTSVRYQTDSLGSRQTDITFSDVQQAAIGLFLLFPTAPFYVVELGASRLNEELQSQATQMTQLLSLTQAAGRTVLPVGDVTPLANARAALFSLQGAASSRTTPFSSISSVPAFQRFSSNVDVFLKANSPSVVSSGQVVPAPQDAKKQIRTLLSSFLTTQRDLISKATLLSNALTDYNSADLPAVATSSIFSNATQNVAVLVAQLEQQSPTQRLESLRDTVLQLLSTRAVIRQVGSFTQPSSIYPFIGTGAPYSDASHLATPATLPAVLYAPYNISGTPLITIALDGLPSQSSNLNNSLFAELFGTKLEPFVVPAATSAAIIGTNAGPFTIPANGTFAFTASIPGSQSVQVVLTTTLSGAGISTAAITADLNAQLALAYPALFPLYSITPDISTNFVELSAVGLGPSYGVAINAGTLNTVLGFTLGQSSAGTSTGVQLQVEETTSSTIVAVSIAPGTYSAAAMVAALNPLLGPYGFTAFAQGNSGHQFIDIRYVGGGSIPTAPFSAGIQFLGTSDPLASILGMPINITFNAQPSTARSVIKNLNTLFPTLNATVEVDPIAQGFNINVRSEPTDPSRLVAYLTSGSGTAASGGVGTIQVTTPPGLLAAGAQIGDSLVIRSGANANTKWAITAVTDTLVTATGGTAVPGACTYEIGPNFTVSYGYVVQISSGINNGIYTITKQGPTVLHVPFEFEVNAVVHGIVQSNGLPYVSIGSVGREKVVFNSENTTIQSAISVSGAGSALFFSGAPPFTAIGTTPWIQLSDVPAGLGPGDTVEYYNTHYNIPDLTFQIQSLTGSILGVAPDISDTQVLSFNENVPPPFSLLRSGAYKAFQILSQQLQAWLAQPANQEKLFAQLQVALNVVMSEPQTTPAQVNTAILLLQQIQDLLVQSSSSTPLNTLEYALVSYSVNRVQPVDNLIKTYSEKGADKALDTLLGGQFLEFFGLDQHGVSYAGSMQAQIRTVALNDLPVRKTDRASTVTSQVQSSSASPDFEYASSDVDKTTAPNVPTEFEKISPVDQNP
jgi:hypothetical protein